MSATATKTQPVDVYSMVTDRMVALLEKGVCPWRKPWNDSACKGSRRSFDTMGPANYISNRSYSGINTWLLLGTALERGYSSRYWVTFNQVRTLGGKVRKGEKATPVVFWRVLSKEVVNVETGERETKKIFFLRYYNVFNVEQTEGVREIKRGAVAAPVETPEEPTEAAEEMVGLSLLTDYLKRESIPLHHGGNRACYSFADDISMPHPEAFISPAHYTHTLAHEAVHSTGAKSRLNRFDLAAGSGIFGSESYSKEELVAEMGASYLSALAGTLPELEENAAAYLAGWSKKLKSDSKLIVYAASAAEKAARLIATGSAVAPKVEDETEAVEELAAA
jgi:antirestriction protein ArdC